MADNRGFRSSGSEQMKLNLVTESVVHMGTVIPFDGIVAEGEAMVNQASLTGESVPVGKDTESSYVYAGTVMEEGELTIRVKETSGSTKFEKIVTMIEESEKLKSGSGEQGRVIWQTGWFPIHLGGTVLTYAAHTEMPPRHCLF